MQYIVRKCSYTRVPTSQQNLPDLVKEGSWFAFGHKNWEHPPQGFTRPYTQKHQKVTGAHKVCPAISQGVRGYSSYPPRREPLHLAQEASRRSTTCCPDMEGDQSSRSPHISWALSQLASTHRIYRLQTRISISIPFNSKQRWLSLSAAISMIHLHLLTGSLWFTVLCLQRGSSETKCKHAGIWMTKNAWISC